MLNCKMSVAPFVNLRTIWATSFKDVRKEDVRALKDAVEKIKNTKEQNFEQKKRISKEYLVKISENCELGRAFF